MNALRTHTLLTVRIGLAPASRLAITGSNIFALRGYVSAPHYKDTPQLDGRPVDATPPAPPLKAEESHVHEDWVMFHPVYTKEELKTVDVLHRKPKQVSDHIARGLVKFARTCFDVVSGYTEKDADKALAEAKAQGKSMTLEELRKEKIVMDDKQWMARIIFLESIAGVPGMVAGVLRHLKSLRGLKRDSGWIHTLLSEAENERMHLMSFLTIRQPSLWMRLMILGAQGVFFNAFFFSYLIAPKSCHRFVSYLEQEAVHTYTGCIKEMEAGRLPEWEHLKAPKIAVEYWRLPEGATLLDMIYAVRADEAQHRFVNGSLANLESTDVNPFAISEAPPSIRGTQLEFTREESLAWGERISAEARAKLQQNIKADKETLISEEKLPASS